MEPSDILVWLQTTIRRDAEPTMRSIERSDIEGRYIVVTDKVDRKFPRDYPGLQTFWEASWREMAELANVRRCKWILRLEDDVLVNRHILHNLCRWRAPSSSLFGLGTLFCPNYWLKRPELFLEDAETGTAFRNIRDVEGAQGQFVATDMVETLLAGVPRALEEREANLSFDWSLSRAAWQFGKRVFVHQPALVTNHETSRHSTIAFDQHLTGVPHDAAEHYWGDVSFKENWKHRSVSEPLAV